MTMATRAIQAVKPHVPMIKFPGKSLDGRKVSVGNMMSSASDLLFSVKPFVTSKPIKTIESKKCCLVLDYVPTKYERKLISLEEMDFIQRGGPE